MFKITAHPAASPKLTPAPWTAVKVWQPIPEAFVFCVESTCADLATDAKTDGIVLYSPWGEYSKVDLTVNISDPILHKHFLNCRVMDTLDQHDPQGNAKYFVCKILLPEDTWSQEQEDQWLAACHGWIYREEWRNSSPLSTLTHS
jgi:hypothetical protein